MEYRALLKGVHLVTLVVLAVSCIATLVWLQPHLERYTVVVCFGVALAYGLAEYYGAEIYVPGWVGPGIPNARQPRKIHFGVTEAPHGFALLVLGPSGVLPICLATALVTAWDRRRWRAVVFNTCHSAISYTLGLALLNAIAPDGIWAFITTPRVWQLGILLCATPLWDAWTFSVLMTVRNGRAYPSAVKEIFGPEVLIGVIPLAMGVLAGVLWYINPAFIVPAGLPVLLAHRAVDAIARWSEEHAKARTYAAGLEEAKATLEERVRERTQEVERLMASRVREAEDAVHDLGHRIHAVETSIDLVQLRLPPAVQDEDAVVLGFERVQETITALRTHLQMVLDAALMQSGHVKLQPEYLDPAALLDEVRGQLIARYGALHCHLEIEPPAEQLRVWCDRLRLERVFFNLLDNAAKYAAHHAAANGQHASVQVSFMQASDQIGCQVRDNGPGLDAAALQVLGERGRRLTDDPTRIEGNGLGLSFCFRALALMGGVLKPESPGLGKGSTFTAWLPKAPSDDAGESL